MIIDECAYLYIKSVLWVLIRMVPIFMKKKVQVGNDQENAQSERNSHSKIPNIIIN